MTANGFDEDMQSCFNLGFDAYLTKPVGASRLYQTLEEFFYRNFHFIHFLKYRIDNIEKLGIMEITNIPPWGILKIRL